MLSNLTSAQKMTLVGIVISAFAGSAAQFTPIFGSVIATDVASVASFLGPIVNGFLFVMTGQGAQLQNVAAMPGVERVSINAQANSVIATAATDPAQPKIGPSSPDVRSTLVATAKAG